MAGARRISTSPRRTRATFRRVRHLRTPLALASISATISLIAACSGGGDTPGSSSTASSSSSSSSGAGGGGGTGGATNPPAPTRKKITGDVTWQVTFDDAAKAAGATDCSYTRHYEGYEDRSAPWLCPTCAAAFRADVTMTAGATDCYPQLSSSAPAKVEWIGYDGAGAYQRSAGGPLSEQGTAAPSAQGFDVANTVAAQDAPAGGTLGFAVTGSFTVAGEEGDVMNGFVPPAAYACGWPKADPPPYTGDYVLQKGAIMPDGLFKDACDETVRLHDFAGSYLVVEMSARNCGPCQQMASEEEAFVADLAAQGVDVKVITLLCPALEDVVGNTTTAMLKTWISSFKLTSPVLADRGYGLSLFEPAIGADTLGYPSWMVVAPDLTVLDFNTGTALPEIKAEIVAHAGK